MDCSAAPASASRVEGENMASSYVSAAASLAVFLTSAGSAPAAAEASDSAAAATPAACSIARSFAARSRSTTVSSVACLSSNDFI